jgi:hypothetical protein
VLLVVPFRGQSRLSISGLNFPPIPPSNAATMKTNLSLFALLLLAPLALPLTAAA